MMTSPCPTRGFSLVETVVSVAIVSVMFVAVLTTVSASVSGQAHIEERARGRALAEGLLAEMLPLPYEDPDQSPVFGPETGEPARPRDQFDDIDDFHNWVGTPPQAADGTPLPLPESWTRRVYVAWVDPASLDTPLFVGASLKRITIVVEHDGRPVAEAVALRTDRTP